MDVVLIFSSDRENTENLSGIVNIAAQKNFSENTGNCNVTSLIT